MGFWAARYANTTVADFATIPDPGSTPLHAIYRYPSAEYPTDEPQCTSMERFFRFFSAKIEQALVDKPGFRCVFTKDLPIGSKADLLLYGYRVQHHQPGYPPTTAVWGQVMAIAGNPGYTEGFSVYLVSGQHILENDTAAEIDPYWERRSPWFSQLICDKCGYGCDTVVGGRRDGGSAKHEGTVAVSVSCDRMALAN